MSVKLWLYNAKMVLGRIALDGRVDSSCVRSINICMSNIYIYIINF